MHVDDLLGPPIPLGKVVRNPLVLPSWAWLYTSERGEVSFSTICRATVSDSRDLSDDEYELRDATLDQAGFVSLMSRDQIEDVIANLHHRHPNPTREQLEEAIRFYLENDAFLVR